MSSTSIETSGGGHTHQGEPRPLIIAAYRYGDPFRKRRVKVAPNIAWKEFLGLVYSRLEISPDSDIEIYDEKGIEIVSVEDLVENDILVVKEVNVKTAQTKRQPVASSPAAAAAAHASFGHSYPPPHHPSGHMTSSSVAQATSSRSHDIGNQSHGVMGMVQLAHFIQSNSFGYYFLAEVENVRLLPSQGKLKKTHCIVKVPHTDKSSGTQQTFECEAALLRHISGHKSVISPPSVQILDPTSDPRLRSFYASVPAAKQPLLQTLFASGSGCLEAYVYPLYGITMATKIKTGLSPDKVLKYSYQLAEIMLYLQQRGVVHQNLLPENIQVMSNDRVVLCNFETAVQTDPNSCLLVVSRNVVAPSNRKGLAPEVIGSFARLRIETATIDYSTQYPWSFGVLSVLMATGQHPLRDYPSGCESGGRVKYRSHQYLALPSSDHFPSLFCKVVKRSLSCDPLRRPGLGQVISVMKKDCRIYTLMSGRKTTGAAPSTASRSHDHRQGRYGSVEPVATEQKGHSHDRGFYDTHPPPATFDLRPNAGEGAGPRPAYLSKYTPVKQPSYDPFQHEGSHMTSHDLSNRSSHDFQNRSHDARRKLPPDQTIADPFAPIHHSSRSSWDTFTDDPLSHLPPPSSDVVKHEGLVLKRHSSSGAFSDDFVLIRTPSAHSLHMERGGGGGGRVQTSGTSRAAALATSESDLSQPVVEWQYQRLVASPNLVPSTSSASPGERSPASRRSDTEQLLHPSSPECDYTASGSMQEITSHLQEYTRNIQRDYRPQRESLGSRATVGRSFSYRLATHDGGKGKPVSPLMMRRSLSDIRHVGTGNQAVSMAASSLASPRSYSAAEVLNRSHDSHMASDYAGNVTGTTDTTTTTATSTSPPTTGEPDSQEGGMPLPNEESLMSPLLSPVSAGTEIPSGESFWSSFMDPSGSHSEPAHSYLFSLDGSASGPTHSADRSRDHMTSHDQYATPKQQNFSDLPEAIAQTLAPPTEATPLLQEEELTPKEEDGGLQLETASDFTLLGSMGVALETASFDPNKVASWIEDGVQYQPTNQSASSSHVTQPTNETTPPPPPPQQQDLASFTPKLRGSYDVMSPIPEASQEFTSSQASRQSGAARTRSHSQAVSLSPPLEEPQRQRSVSPFRHSGLSASSGHTQSTEHASSSVLTALNSAQQQQQGKIPSSATPLQLEPPSAGSETSSNISNARSSAGDESRSSSARALVGADISRTETRSQHLTSSSESNERVSRGTSPPRAPSSSPSRPLSPLATTSQSANVSPHQRSRMDSSTRDDPNVVQEQTQEHTAKTGDVGASVKPMHGTTTAPQTSPHSGGSGSNETADSSLRRDNRSPLTELTGSNTSPSHLSGPATGAASSQSSIPAGVSGLMSRGARLRYSQQRHTERGRSSRRMSQELAIMNLAISGMDSGSQRSKTQSPPSDDSRLLRPISPALTPHRSTSAPVTTLSSTTRQLTSPDAPQLSGSNDDPTPSSSTSVPPPPQVEADSYDYLPPYSPPRLTAQERQNESEEQTATAAAAATQAPPRQQNRSTGETRLYTAPPPSYDEIFGASRRGNGGARHKNRQRGSSSRQRSAGQTRSTSSSAVGASVQLSEPSGARQQSRGHPLTRQSTNQRRLASITNLFRKTRRNSSSSSHQQQEPTPPVVPSEEMDASEYTASWVASYSHTPRPIDAARFRMDALSSVSAPAYPQGRAQSSRALSDITTSRTARREGNPPIPYRHPPPFPLGPSAEGESPSRPPSESHQVSTAPANRQLQQYGSRSHVTLRELSRNRNRPRPASEMVSSSGSGIPVRHQHRQQQTSQRSSTSQHQQQQQEERSRALENSGGFSSSCFDILSLPSTEQGTASETTGRGRGQVIAGSTPSSTDPPAQRRRDQLLNRPRAVPRSQVVASREHPLREQQIGAQETQPAEREQPTPEDLSTPNEHQRLSLTPTTQPDRQPTLPSPLQRDGEAASNDTTLAVNANANNTNATASPRSSTHNRPPPTPSSSDPPPPPPPSAQQQQQQQTTVLSTRVAARLRAESRRSQQEDGGDSSAEDRPASRESGDGPASSRNRLRAARRRRSSQDSAGGRGRGEESSSQQTVIECAVATTTLGSHDTEQSSQVAVPESCDQVAESCDQVTGSQAPLMESHDVSCDTSRDLPTGSRNGDSRESDATEIQTVEMVLGSTCTDTSGHKSCGHNGCERSQAELCCICAGQRSREICPAHCTQCQRRHMREEVERSDSSYHGSKVGCHPTLMSTSSHSARRNCVLM